MVGGVSGLMGAILVGPRKWRFDANGKPNPISGHNTTMMALGTIILWFGWFETSYIPCLFEGNGPEACKKVHKTNHKALKPQPDATTGTGSTADLP